MTNPLKSRFKEILESLKEEGTVEIINEEEKASFSLKEVEKDLDDYRFENQKRIKDSQEDIATVVLTS